MDNEEIVIDEDLEIEEIPEDEELQVKYIRWTLVTIGDL